MANSAFQPGGGILGGQVGIQNVPGSNILVSDARARLGKFGLIKLWIGSPVRVPCILSQPDPKEPLNPKKKIEVKRMVEVRVADLRLLPPDAPPPKARCLTCEANRETSEWETEQAMRASHPSDNELKKNMVAHTWAFWSTHPKPVEQLQIVITDNFGRPLQNASPPDPAATLPVYGLMSDESRE